jgi:hypothetical protein
MNNMSLERRVFICFVIVVAFFCSGCSSTKWEWLPQEPHTDDQRRGEYSRLDKDRKEVGGVQITVLKASF